jgi:competence protein ComEA
LRLKKLIRDFFGFSKTEINGTLVLVPLIVLILFTPYLYRQITDAKNHTLNEDKRLLDSLVSLIDASFYEEAPTERSIVSYFDFDPNMASVEELESLGVPTFLANRINNYRSKGGVFFIKTDLLKIFDFPDSLFNTLAPFVLLPDQRVEIIKPKEDGAKKLSLKQPVEIKERKADLEGSLLLDINTSDSTQFKKLRGIGSSYARRIISYRTLLGGYQAVDQLREVYGMNDTLFNSIKPYIILSDSVSIRKVPINLATFKELLAHPYIDYEQTKEILNLKSKNGKFRKPEDMFRLKLMDSLAIEQLLPYLDFR